jgi:hypothetical protein
VRLQTLISDAVECQFHVSGTAADTCWIEKRFGCSFLSKKERSDLQDYNHIIRSQGNEILNLKFLWH